MCWWSDQHKKYHKNWEDKETYVNYEEASQADKSASKLFSYALKVFQSFPFIQVGLLSFSWKVMIWARPSIRFLRKKYLFYVYKCFACLYAYAPSVYLLPKEVRRGHWTPGTRVSGFESSCGKQVQVLCESNKCSIPTHSLCSPTLSVSSLTSISFNHHYTSAPS